MTTAMKQRLPRSAITPTLSASLLLLLALIAPLPASAQLMAPTPTSSSCTPSDCIVSWSQSVGVDYQLQVNLDSMYEDAGVGGNFDFVQIAPLFDLYTCRNFTARVMADDSLETDTSDPATIMVTGSGGPATPDAPSISVLGSDRISAMFTTNSLSSSSHWVHTYTLSIQKESGGPIETFDYTPTYPQNDDTVDVSHTFVDLDDNTRYSVWVTAVSCVGSAMSASATQKTSLNIVIDDGSNDPRFLHVFLNITGLSLDPADFPAELFFAALSTVLADNSFTVSGNDMGIVSLEPFGGVMLVMEAQFNVTAGTADDISMTLAEVMTPPCSSDFTDKLKSFSASRFSSTCVSFDSAEAGLDNRLQSGSGGGQEGSTSTDWKMPVIYAAAGLGGAILVAIIVYLIVLVVRQVKENRIYNEPKVNLDIELGQATLY